MTPFKRPRLLLGIVCALLLVISISSMTGAGGIFGGPDWPASVSQKATDIPLSRAYRMVQDNVPGARAGVLDDYLYIEGPGADWGLSPERSDTSDTADAGAKPGREAKGAGETVTYRALLPRPSHAVIENLIATSGIPLEIYRNPTYQATFSDRVFQVLPLVLIIAALWFFMRKGGSKGLGINTAFEIIESDKLTEGFEDVAGIDTARDEIGEIVDFLKDPAAASRLGGRMPKGALFSGPPGTGKTLLARAMAREAGVPFMNIEASGINQIFMGAGAMKIKRAFREARKNAPCIVFIDEIDAMGRARGSSHSGAGDEKESTLNALLVELDGFDPREGVVVIAATNRPEILDPALTRRGRIDRRIHIDLPDLHGRTEILRIHARRIKAEAILDFPKVAASTFGFSGADLAALVNEAALLATRRGAMYVEKRDFDDARDRLIIGLSSYKRTLSNTDRHLTSVHEAGHALIAGVLRDADKIEKATILPQGPALGYVMQSPGDDRNFQTRAQIKARIRVAVAGRVAEEMIFGEGHVTSGAASDIEAATGYARAMVTRYGMDPTDTGFVLIDPQDPVLFDPEGRTLERIRGIIQTEIGEARRYMTEHKPLLDNIAKTLQREETIEGAVIYDLLGSQARSIEIDPAPGTSASA